MNFKALALTIGATLALSAPAFASESGTSTTVSNTSTSGVVVQVQNSVQKIDGIQIDVSSSNNSSQSGGTIVPGQPGGAGGSGGSGFGSCGYYYYYSNCSNGYGGNGGNGGAASAAQYLGGSTSASNSASVKITNFSSVATMSQTFIGTQNSNSTTNSVSSFSNF
jgi:hypothetical protein